MFKGRYWEVFKDLVAAGLSESVAKGSVERMIARDEADAKQRAEYAAKGADADGNLLATWVNPKHSGFVAVRVAGVPSVGDSVRYVTNTKSEVRTILAVYHSYQNLGRTVSTCLLARVDRTEAEVEGSDDA